MPWYLEDASTGERLGPNPTNPDLINWIALAQPRNLAATEQPDGTFLLTWNFAETSTEGAFRLERRESNTEPWELLDTIPAATSLNPSTHLATAPAALAPSQPGKTASIRVTYQYGTRRSAPSNIVALANADTEGAPNGLPDWWERQHGMTPGNPANATRDDDEDGLTNAEEYALGTNPNKKDTDDDGKNDKEDPYPTDNRRTHILPVIRFVAVDVSTAAIGTKDVWSVAVDESNQVGFAWNKAATQEYEAVVWRNGAVVRTQRLPYSHLDSWWYAPVMVNADGVIAGITSHAGANGLLKWGGGPPPTNTADLVGNLGLGITNSGICWGWGGDSDSVATFIGDTLFGSDENNPPPFNFGIYAPPQNISGNGNAAGANSTGAAAWLNASKSFFTVFANDSAATYLGIDDSAEILGFSDKLTGAAWFPHADETVLHAFWYSDGSPSDFYFELPDGFGSHIAFTRIPGTHPFFSPNGDMMFSAKIAEQDAQNQKIWRDGTLLWDRQKQTVSEVILPDYPEIGGTPRMTNAHVMAGLQWKQDATGQPYRAAVLLLPLEIVPDDGVAGVVGDMVQSINRETGEKHFVSPKKSTQIPQIPDDYVTLKAVGVTQELFQSFFAWEPVAGGEAIQGDPLKYRVKRDLARKVEVKVKMKSSGQISAKMNVWVIWADVIATPGEQTFHPNNGSESIYETTSEFDKGWRFIFKIKPAAICDGSIPDYPNLKGSSKQPVPGARKPYAPNPALPADTAERKWDVSRQVKQTLRNPGSIPKDKLLQALAESMVVDQPKAAATAVDFPANDDDAEGNDDTTGHSEIPDVDPYQAAPTGLTHQLAEIASFDAPLQPALNSWGAAGWTFSSEMNFREFARVELWDGKREGGKFWFRISDFTGDALWHHYFNVTWDAATASWLNANSNSDKGHPKP